MQALEHRLQQVEVDSWSVGVMIVFCGYAMLNCLTSCGDESCHCVLWMVVAAYGWIVLVGCGL